LDHHLNTLNERPVTRLIGQTFLPHVATGKKTGDKRFPGSCHDNGDVSEGAGVCDASADRIKKKEKKSMTPADATATTTRRGSAIKHDEDPMRAVAADRNKSGRSAPPKETTGASEQSGRLNEFPPA
jgi:hypothetical protein